MSDKDTLKKDKSQNQASSTKPTRKVTVEPKDKEIGGPKGLEPTRYGDWESKGRCYDF